MELEKPFSQRSINTTISMPFDLYLLIKDQIRKDQISFSEYVRSAILNNFRIQQDQANKNG